MSIKLPCCIKLAFHFISWGRCTVKQPSRFSTSGGGREYPTCSKRTRVYWIGYILRRNCLLKQVIEGKVDETGRRGIICKQPLDDLKKTRRYWKWKHEALCGQYALEVAVDPSQDSRVLCFMYQKGNSIAQWLTVGSNVLQKPPVAHLLIHGAPNVAHRVTRTRGCYISRARLIQSTRYHYTNIFNLVFNIIRISTCRSTEIRHFL